MKIDAIDHIAIAVEDIDATLAVFEKLLGLRATHRETIAGYNVAVATVPIGATAIELVQGLSPESPIAKFIAARGPGLHHVALQVGNIADAIAAVTRAGGNMIDTAPRPGKEGSKVAFIHPKSTGKVLLELVENRKGRRST